MYQKLMVYTSERTIHDGKPVHRALVRTLRATGARGATGCPRHSGFHVDRPPHGDQLFQLGRSVPVVTASPHIVDERTSEHGDVISELVPAVRVVTESERRGRLGLANISSNAPELTEEPRGCTFDPG
jgi:PII-like signaling protein